MDAGILYLEHFRLARAADAAALAGAQELPDTSKTQAVAVNYARQNGIDTSDPANFIISFSPDNKRITVEIKKTVNLFFAKVFGINTSLVNGRAVAKIAPVSKVQGLIPIGIDESLLPLSHGQQCVIKVGFPQTGWTGILAYPGQSGADDYRNSSRYGYGGYVSIGDNVDKATGNVTGPTLQGIQERIDASGDTWDNYGQNCPRLVLVPIYRNLGALPTDKVRIIGFASVFLEFVSGNGMENEVHVRYVNHTISGETDDTQTNSYLNSVRLIE